MNENKNIKKLKINQKLNNENENKQIIIIIIKDL